MARSSSSPTVRRDFAAATLRTLRKRGIVVMSPTSLPADGPHPWANASRGYTVDDNGCGRVWTFAEVLEAAR